MNTQAEQQILPEAYDHLLRILKKSTVNEWEEMDESEQTELREALYDTYLTFWKNGAEPVDVPKVGEWWYCRIMETNGIPVRIKAITGEGKYLCEGSNWLGHTVYQDKELKDLLGRVPPRFPRIAKLLAFLSRKTSC